MQPRRSRLIDFGDDTFGPAMVPMVEGGPSISGPKSFKYVDIGDGHFAQAIVLLNEDGTPFVSGGVTDHGLLTGLADDDHPQYQLRTEKAQANGYAGLGAGGLVPTAQLGTGTANSTKYLAGDGSWQTTPIVISAHSGLSGLSADDHTQYLLVDGTRAMSGSLVLAGGTAGIAVTVAEDVAANKKGSLTYSGSTAGAFQAFKTNQLLIYSGAGATAGMTFQREAGNAVFGAQGSFSVTMGTPSGLSRGGLALAGPDQVFLLTHNICGATVNVATGVGSYTSLIVEGGLGVGTNVAGFPLLLAGGLGTGTALAGDTIIQYAPVGSSGAVPQTRADAWLVKGSTGHLVAGTDNTFDIGAVGATRPRNLYLGNYFQLTEITPPSAPATNNVRFYAEDNGAGKTRLMALFPTGSAQQVAIEP